MSVVWLLTGIWHGANWTFLIWGVWYLLTLLIEKTVGGLEVDKNGKAKCISLFVGGVRRVLTLSIVVMGWVIFRSDSLKDAVHYIGAMFGYHASSIVDLQAINYIKNGGMGLSASIILSMPVYSLIKNRVEKHEIMWQILESLIILAVFICSLFAVIGSTYHPFIYFHF